MSQVIDSFLLTFEFLNCVLRIRYRDGTGTAIRVTVGQRDRLVTALHLVEGLEVGDNIGIRASNGWLLFQVSELITDEDQDLCIITFNEDLNGGLSADVFEGSIHPGQSILACGFPLGFEQQLDLEDMNIPVPLIKSGVFSGRVILGSKQQRLFDLHNNVGFSGGPIFHWDFKSKKVKICGIISNYKFDAPNFVLKRINGKPKPTDCWTRDNSGFTVAYHPKKLLEQYSN